MKNRLIRLLPAALLAAATAAQADTLLGTLNGKNFYLTSAATTWTAQEAYAVGLGGHLASIHSLAEQNLISAGVAANYSATSFVWIGFTDQVTEGNFQWSDGSAVNYTFWNSGEPNDASGEDYAVINWNTTTGQWNDLPNNAYNSQAVYELSSVPGPAAIAPFVLGSLATLRRRRKAR